MNKKIEKVPRLTVLEVVQEQGHATVGHEDQEPAAKALIAVDTTAHQAKNPAVAQRFPHNLPAELNLVLGQNGVAYAVMRDAANPYVLPVGSRVLNNIIREIARQTEVNLRKADIADINHYLQAQAETAGIIKPVWYRVAPVPGGIEIDPCDDCHNRVRITAGKVEVLTGGSETLFYRSSVAMPMGMPAEG